MKMIVVLMVLVSICLLWGSAEFSPEERSFDFGRIFEKDGEVDHRFNFTNTGDEPLLIIDVHAS